VICDYSAIQFDQQGLITIMAVIAIPAQVREGHVVTAAKALAIFIAKLGRRWWMAELSPVLQIGAVASFEIVSCCFDAVMEGAPFHFMIAKIGRWSIPTMIVMHAVAGRWRALRRSILSR
jgi:hypothetical protein